MSIFNRNNSWRWIVLVVLLTSFGLSFLLFGNSLQAVKWALMLAGISVGLLRLRQLKNDQIASRLSKEEYSLKEAGGALKLKIQSGTVRAIGWLFITLLCILVLAFLLITRNLSGTFLLALLLGFLFAPFGIYCLRSAERDRRTAEKKLGSIT